VALGEEGAWLVGVHVRRLVVVQGLLACLLAAAAVSAAGLIGFVGLLVPHLARGLVGPGHRALLPTSLALGGGLLVLADGLARVVHPPLELPVGVVTAAIGAPFLAWILLRPRAA
jgi:iron complex transport system permease protein